MNKIITILLIGLLALTGFIFSRSAGLNHVKEELKWQLPAENYDDILVDRVVDGDTLHLENNRYVRLIGIDTPEMHESNKLKRDVKRTGQDEATIKLMGRKAYEFTRNFVEGKRIKLEFDIEKIDKYNRLLAYAYLKDGTFINAKIVEEGYASVMTYFPNVKYADLFLRLYRQASQDQRGLWK